jgi:hypothetical protein
MLIERIIQKNKNRLDEYFLWENSFYTYIFFLRIFIMYILFSLELKLYLKTKNLKYYYLK